MTKTFRALRMEDEKEDFSWAQALDDSERLEIATRLVSDLWSAAHDGSPFPPMDRTVYSYIPVAATTFAEATVVKKNAKDAKN